MKNGLLSVNFPAAFLAYQNGLAIECSGHGFEKLIVDARLAQWMRSQANTAKLLQDNPTLMRLRELEVLEKIATSGKLSVILGEKGLSDRVTNLL